MNLKERMERNEWNGTNETEGMEQNEIFFQKVGTRPAQELGTVPLNRWLFHRNKWKRTNDFLKSREHAQT